MTTYETPAGTVAEHVPDLPPLDLDEMRRARRRRIDKIAK